MTLREKLESFNGANSEIELTKKFEDLAPSFLYGGYYNVDNKYWIFIRTVEFYFHTEKDSKLNIKDPIVYHRNNKHVEGEVPYFKTMALHAHSSGYDITFENETMKYRASALIRAYEVYSVEKEEFLVYNPKISTQFLLLQDNQSRANTQSTYLYNFLNGFYDNNVHWVDTNIPQNHKTPIQKERKNVFKSTSDEEYKPNDNKIKDDRKWSFTRQEEIVLPKNNR